MKKYYSIFVLAAAAVAAFSCTKEVAEVETPATDGIAVTITTGADTKTSLSSSKTISWYDGDAIGVSDGTSSNVSFPEINIGDDDIQKVATFKGTVDAAGTYYAYFPYSSLGVSAGVASVNLPATQELRRYWAIDPAADLLVSKSFDVSDVNPSVNDLVFKRLGAFVNFIFVDKTTGTVLGSEHITWLSVTADTPLAGVVGIDVTGAALTGILSAPSNTIEANIAAGNDFANASGYVLGVYPQTLAKDSHLTIQARVGSYIVKKTVTLPNAVDLKAGSITTIKVEFGNSEKVIQRLWGKYPVAEETPWTSEYSSTYDFIQGNDRTMAADNEYVYFAAANDSQKGIMAVSLTDPSVTKAVDMTGVSGGYFETACVRTIYNPDNDKYILLAGSLAYKDEAHDTFIVYAWKDGIDAAPTKIISWATTAWGATRRVGDFFTVVGDWKKGEIWARRNADGAQTFRWTITNGTLGEVQGVVAGYGGSYGMGSVYKYNLASNQFIVVTPTIGRFYSYNESFEVDSGGIDWAGIDNSVMACKFGITPFEFNGNKYIAYVKEGAYDNSSDNKCARIKIIKDKGDASQFMASLEADEVVYEFPIQNSNNAVTEDQFNEVYFPGKPSKATQFMGNCSVIVTPSCVYLVGHLYNVGVSVFKLFQ